MESIGHNAIKPLKPTMADQLSRELSLECFERQILKCNDIAELQNIAIRQKAQMHSMQKVYESLLRDTYPYATAAQQQKSNPHLPFKKLQRFLNKRVISLFKAATAV